MTYLKRLRKHLLSGLVAGILLSGLTASAEALTITRTGTDVDGRKAWVRFEQAGAGTNLVVTLANISPNDVDGTGPVNADEYILTGVFFNLVGTILNPTLGKVSAVLADQVNSSGTQITTDSFAFCPGTPCAPPVPNSTGSNIGGEWGYLANSAGLGKATPQTNVISTDGYGLTDWDATRRFDTAQNLSGSLSPDDLDYGLTSFGDVTTTNNDLANSDEFIKNALTFTFSVPGGYTLASVEQVRFQYGDNANDPFIDVPAPGALMLLGSGLLGLGSFIELRRRKQTATEG